MSFANFKHEDAAASAGIDKFFTDNPIRYTITAIKKSGARELAFDKNSRNTYETEEAANEQLKAVISNNAADKILELVGKDLQVRPVKCWSNGDPQTWYFEN